MTTPVPDNGKFGAKNEAFRAPARKVNNDIEEGLWVGAGRKAWVDAGNLPVGRIGFSPSYNEVNSKAAFRRTWAHEETAMRKLTVRITAGLAVLGLLTGPQWSAGQLSIGVTVHTSEENPRARMAVKLAAKLAEMLPGILERFQAQRRALLVAGGGDAYPRDGLAALLDSTESALAKELKQEELAPVRDYIGDVFQRARSDLGLSARTARRRSSTLQVALASFRAMADEPPASGPRLERGLVDAVLDPLIAFMKGLYVRATKKDFIVDLCVVSDPQEGARVAIHSKSDKEIYERKTTGRLESLFRGKYVYKVEKRGFRTIECAASSQCSPINLWPMRQPVLVCDLNDGTCEVREGNWPDACHR